MDGGVLDFTRYVVESILPHTLKVGMEWWKLEDRKAIP